MGGMKAAIISMMRSALHHKSQVPAIIYQGKPAPAKRQAPQHRLIVCYRDRTTRVSKRGACFHSVHATSPLPLLYLRIMHKSAHLILGLIPAL